MGLFHFCSLVRESDLPGNRQNITFGIYAQISVCQIQSLRVYHDGLASKSGYNKKVSQGIIPLPS